MQQQSKDPLHGKTLEFIITTLVNEFGWDDLGQQIPIKCFKPIRYTHIFTSLY